MEFGIINGEPYYKRLPLDRDTVNRVTVYGQDNLYPQRAKESLLRSPIGLSCVELIAAFIRGDGFENDRVINDQGDTANDILKLISWDQSAFRGWGVHTNNNLNGDVTELTYIPFEFIRLGLATQKGIIKDVKVSNNWEQYDQTLPSPNELNEVRFSLYNPQDVQQEVLTTAKGMVYYSTPKKNTYPLASFDAVWESLQADSELQIFELANIVNGFISLSVFKLPSGGNDEDEQIELSKKLNTLKGAKNANSIIVASVDEDWAGGDLIEQVPANNNDTLYTGTLASVKNRLLQNWALPASLLGMLPDGALFTAQQIADDFKYMNARVRDQRLDIERQFEKMGLDVGKIIPREFESSPVPTAKELEDAITN